MSEKISIFVENAPTPYGHFTQAIKVENHVCISGQLPLKPEENVLVGDDIESQAKAVFHHLTAIMQGCTGQLSNITIVRFYLTDLSDHEAVDKVSREFFYFVPPARTVVQVAALPFGAKVMVEAEAELNPVEFKGGRML